MSTRCGILCDKETKLPCMQRSNRTNTKTQLEKNKRKRKDSVWHFKLQRYGIFVRFAIAMNLICWNPQSNCKIGKKRKKNRTEQNHTSNNMQQATRRKTGNRRIVQSIALPLHTCMHACKPSVDLFNRSVTTKRHQIVFANSRKS